MGSGYERQPIYFINPPSSAADAVITEVKGNRATLWLGGVNLAAINAEQQQKIFMALWRLYYHLVWGTKNRQPLINPDRETVLYHYMIGKADALACIVHAIGGVDDHIHLVVSILPTLSIADFVKNIKGSSAYHLNQSLSDSSDKFGWQEGYGVFSLGGKQLEQAVAYVQNQKSHHLNGTTISSLEEYNHQNDSPSRWHPS